MKHLWVLGILLSVIVLLAFLGFFKSQEGFQSYVGLLPTTFQGFNPPIDVSGIDKPFEHLLIGGILVDQSTETTEDPITIVSPNPSNPAQFLLGAGANMALIEFAISNKNLIAKLVSAKAKSAEADSNILNAWSTGISKTVRSDSGEGYKIKNLRVKVSATKPSNHLLQDDTAIHPATQMIRCPPGYTFFNGPNGDSMCCNGTINPYTHQCDAKGPNAVCAFSRKGNLPLCDEITTRSIAASATAMCPPSLPHFAKESDTAEKCCKNPVQLLGATGFKCSDQDLADSSKYCIAKGTPTRAKDGLQEKLCDEAVMLDTTSCPAGTGGARVFQNVEYVLGEREATKYASPSLVGKTIPVCFGMNQVCIPDDAIRYAQRQGAFTDYDPATWEYSCSVWSQKHQGKSNPAWIRGYLDRPATSQ